MELLELSCNGVIVSGFVIRALQFYAARKHIFCMKDTGCSEPFKVEFLYVLTVFEHSAHVFDF